MSSLLSFLKTPYFLIGFSFLVLIAAVIMGVSLNSPSAIEGLSKTKLKIIPVINIAEEKTNCLLESNIVTSSVDAPSENQEFMMGTPIQLKGNYEFKCKSFFTEEEFGVKTEWSLGDSGNVFSNDQNTTLNNSTPGNHKVTFKVKVDVNGEVFESTTGRNFRVKAPVTQTPTPTPTQAPNQAPVALITAPADGSSFSGCPVMFGTTGTGTDPEDGILSGASMQWYYQGPSGPRVSFGTGPTALYYNNVYVNGNQLYNFYLVVTDSQGLTNEDQIKVTINTNACG